tara:strand:+ start:5571 stop:6731 length:1161 start_codon:yes stop_codon:yes gene_type:complete
MKLKVYNSISLINPKDWNSILHHTDIFNEHEFLYALEKAKVEKSITKYLCFYKDERLIATSVVSVFYLNLALFIGDNAFVRLIQKIFSRFFHLKVLFVGTPLSAGQNHLRITSKNNFTEILNKHLDWANKHCKENNIKHCIFKEFEQNETHLFSNIFKEHNYFKACSIPTVKMSLNYSDYSEYISNLRSGYRRQIQHSLKKAGISNFKFEFEVGPKHNSDTEFSIISLKEYGVEKFYNLYLNVLDRAEVKLETLNQEFFEQLSKDESSTVQLLRMCVKDQDLGVFAFSIRKEELTFIWTAKAASKDKYHSYQNLLQALICYGITKGCKTLVLGQTAYYPKMRVGGTPEDLFLFYKAQSNITHSILKLFNSIIFPRLKLKPLKTFNT